MQLVSCAFVLRGRRACQEAAGCQCQTFGLFGVCSVVARRGEDEGDTKERYSTEEGCQQNHVASMRGGL